jgi:hypothetical protein
VRAPFALFKFSKSTFGFFNWFRLFLVVHWIRAQSIFILFYYFNQCCFWDLGPNISRPPPTKKNKINNRAPILAKKHKTKHNDTNIIIVFDVMMAERFNDEEICIEYNDIATRIFVHSSREGSVELKISTNNHRGRCRRKKTK